MLLASLAEMAFHSQKENESGKREIWIDHDAPSADKGIRSFFVKIA